MAKKEKLKQSEIAEYLDNEYLNDRDIVDYSSILNKLKTLAIKNEIECISGTDYIADECGSTFQILTKFMIKNNKKLKNYLIDPDDIEGSLPGSTVAGLSKEITNYAKYQINAGTYFTYVGDPDDETYAIFNVEQDDSEGRSLRVGTSMSYSLYLIGDKSKKYFRKLKDEIKRVSKLIDINSKYFIHTAPNPSTKEVMFKSFDQMVFRDKDRIINYIDNWCKNIPRYIEYGLTPKLSILLYGDPGTGKSTFTRALAKYLNIHNIISISPDYFRTSLDENKQRPQYHLVSPYISKIIALDDIDCICKSRDNDDSNENGAILSNLLEFLDNPNTFYFKPEGCDICYPVSIVIATTNYYNKLDPAVIRYGRFDLKIEMHEFNEEEAIEFCNIYDLKLSDIYDKPIDKKFKISPSYLQSLCINNIDSKLKENK